MVRRRRLAHELRRLREEAMLTCQEVAARLECSASKISRIETQRVSVSPGDVSDMLALYGVTAEQREGLVQLAREASQPGWWHPFGSSLQPGFATYLGMERAASQISVYAINALPGLLQTRNYARALHVAGVAARAGRAADRSAELTMQRQARASSPTLRVVLDEAALRRAVGGHDVMREQVWHLIGQASMPNIRLQVVPFSRGAYTAMNVAFAIMSFPDLADPDIACVRYPTGTQWIEETAELAAYHALFRHLQAAALSPPDSAAFLASIVKDMQPTPLTLTGLDSRRSE